MAGLRVLLAAGGTGGHLFPAEALAIELRARGASVHLATDVRGMKYVGVFPADSMTSIDAATFRSRSPVALVRTVWTLAKGFFKAWGLVGKLKPDLVIGFGGYPSVAPVLAGWMRGVPTLVHEQNGVIGRANAFLSQRVTGIATGLKTVKGLSAVLEKKVSNVGNPVRPNVLKVKDMPFPTLEALEEHFQFRVLVTGGSQGASVMSDVVPQAMAVLPEKQRRCLRIVHQARGEDLERARAAYETAGVKVELAAFFDDLPARIANSHLVIGRAGASTVAELAVIGRPSILVPLPTAIDQDQAANAASLGDIGGAIVVKQSDFTPGWLAMTLLELIRNPKRLTDSGIAAKSAGIPDAARRLADLVEAVARTKPSKKSRKEKTR